MEFCYTFDPILINEVGVFVLCIMLGYIIGAVLNTHKSKDEDVVHFSSSDWVLEIQNEIVSVLTESRVHLKYSEIGKKLGLNETCVSKTKFKDAMIMVLCEDLVESGTLKASETIGWPYLQLVDK
jgi:hypothetical protein